MANTVSMNEAEASIAQSASDRESFIEAQDKVREWADRSIELSQSGDTEQANQAERCAAAWLSTMLRIESRTTAEAPSPARAKPLARIAGRKDRRVSESEARGNNATLRAWRRSCLLRNLPEFG